VASSRTRQRKLARAKMERQLARRASRARRNRQLQAGLAVGLVAVIAVVVGLFLGGVFSSKPKPAVTATCAYNTPADASTLTDVGRPPTSGEPRTGAEPMTVTTDQGTIGITLDLAKAPCAASSFHYLAGKSFFDNTKCNRLTTSGSFLLQCGDPKGDGSGGPAYTFADENLPAPTASATPSTDASASATPSASASAPASADPSASATPAAATATYPRGTVAMFTKGPDSNGSQFFIVYKDSQLPPSYSIIGTVTTGLDVIDKVAAAGAVDANGAATGDGTPKTPVTIQTLTVGTEPSTGPAPSVSGSAAPSASPSGASNT
jgi:peptidyl-prolyl cis-trans isomerase B (cyclophilin B)